jgi:hypothetical protein
VEQQRQNEREWHQLDLHQRMELERQFERIIRRLNTDLDDVDRHWRRRGSGCMYWSGTPRSCRNSGTCKFAASHIHGKPTSEWNRTELALVLVLSWGWGCNACACWTVCITDNAVLVRLQQPYVMHLVTTHATTCSAVLSKESLSCARNSVCNPWRIGVCCCCCMHAGRYLEQAEAGPFTLLHVKLSAV